MKELSGSSLVMISKGITNDSRGGMNDGKLVEKRKGRENMEMMTSNRNDKVSIHATN